MSDIVLCRGRVTRIASEIFEDDRGVLVPIDFSGYGFQVVRAFVVNAAAGLVRGRHAHAKGRQILMLARGRIVVDVYYEDCAERVTLDSRHRILLIEPRVWTSQTYLSDDAALVVFCDTAYDRNDYICERGRVSWATLTDLPG